MGYGTRKYTLKNKYYSMCKNNFLLNYNMK